MPDVKRTVKLITHQSIIPDQQLGEGDPPLRKWDVSIHLVGPDGDNLPANCFDKVTYNLHESFGKRMRQTIKQVPWMIKEEGWGEFDMVIVCTPVGSSKGGDITINHDLNFLNEEYETTHTITFRNPKPDLQKILAESAPAGEATNGAAATSKAPKRKPGSRSVDMEKLAEALPQLDEEALLQVVQMVHDNKTEDTYTKNDLENGEFHVDLYTLPDNLIKLLWDFTSQRVDMSVLS